MAALGEFKRLPRVAESHTAVLVSLANTYPLKSETRNAVCNVNRPTGQLSRENVRYVNRTRKT